MRNLRTNDVSQLTIKQITKTKTTDLSNGFKELLLHL